MCKPSILIVDDEVSVRSALERWFLLRGFDVDLAEDGVEAVHKCDRQHYDIITMDLEMPRMGGAEAIAAIRLSRPEVPIIVLSGYTHDTRGALDCGAAKVMSKPVRLRELETEIRELLLAGD